MGGESKRQSLSNVMRMTVEELHTYADGLSGDCSIPSYDNEVQSEAMAWKDKGNESFRKKEYQRAVELYTRSIELQSLDRHDDGISALANRSMAYLKLSRYQECVDDCTMVLERDTDHVKSYLRRGRAKQHLGEMQGAIEDFEECLRREPRNSDAIKSRQESIASYLARGEGLRAFPEHHIAVQSGNDRMGYDPVGTPSMDASPPSGVVPTPSDASKKEELPVLQKARIQKKEYKTGVEFEKDWRGCRGDSCQQASMLESIPPESLPVILRQCLSPKLLYQITTVILSHTAQQNPSHAIGLLSSLTQTDRFSVNCMSLSTVQKKELERLWSDVTSSLHHHDDDESTEELIQSLQRLFFYP